MRLHTPQKVGSCATGRGVAILLHKRLPFALEKFIKDHKWRYVIISGFLYGERLILGCIYSPNTFEASLYSKLMADLSSSTSPLIVVGRDLNACLEPELDHCPVKSTHPSRMAVATKVLCCDLNLFDAWRILNPKMKDYSGCSLYSVSSIVQPTAPSDWLHTEPGNSQSAVRAVHAHRSHTG